MLDVGGQDSTEAFEDVGHSDEAREILEGLLVGTVKRGVSLNKPLLRNTSGHSMLTTIAKQPNDPPAKPQQTTTSSQSTGSASQSGMGVGLYAMILVGGAVAFFGYQYMQQSQQKA
jgi:hypothetical protein